MNLVIAYVLGVATVPILIFFFALICSIAIKLGDDD